MNLNRYSFTFLASLTIVSCTHQIALDPKSVEKETEDPNIKPPFIQDPSLDLTKLHPVRYYQNLHDGIANYHSALQFDSWLGANPEEHPNLGRLLQGGTKIHLITLGGGLTAGAQNGGLYREGQLAAYPNLVARQLGMAGFTTPAFSEHEANGTGFDLLLKDNHSYPHFQRVTNKLAKVISQGEGHPPRFNRFNGAVHNFSAPWLTGIPGNDWEPWMIGNVANLLSGVSWPLHHPYVNRFIPEGSSLTDYLRNDHPYNVFVLEDHERFFNVLRNKNRLPLSLGDLIGDIQAGTPHTLANIQFLMTGGRKGVVFTLPQIDHLAYAHWENGLQWSEREQTTYTNAVNTYNTALRKWVTEYDLALVDIESIYRQIHEGHYTTSEGFKIVGGPRGNFFSSDGIYPTVLGQAIVANEVLKAINTTYQAQAPLIPIRSYSEAIGLEL